MSCIDVNEGKGFDQADSQLKEGCVSKEVDGLRGADVALIKSILTSLICLPASVKNPALRAS